MNNASEGFDFASAKSGDGFPHGKGSIESEKRLDDGFLIFNGGNDTVIAVGYAVVCGVIFEG